MADVTIITYGDGGFDASKPNNNIVLVTEQPVDANGDPTAPATVTFTADS